MQHERRRLDRGEHVADVDLHERLPEQLGHRRARGAARIRPHHSRTPSTSAIEPAKRSISAPSPHCSSISRNCASISGRVKPQGCDGGSHEKRAAVP